MQLQYAINHFFTVTAFTQQLKRLEEFIIQDVEDDKTTPFNNA